MKTGLVLGAGGLVGMAYHAGVLKALDESGVDVAGADLIVGTSAGAVIAAHLAAGWTPTDFYEFGMGRHPRAANGAGERKREMRDLFRPLWNSPSERVRRGIGAVFAMGAARGLYPKPFKRMAPAAALRRRFPSGMYSTDRSRERMSEDLPADWPRQGLYICTAELYGGKRVPFGAADAPPASLPEAVLASISIPGVFPPVRIGDTYYVDGGVSSATSLALAAAECDTILCIAPLGYRRDQEAGPLRDPASWSPMIMRSVFTRSLRREVKAARARGRHVLVFRPPMSELKQHGTNFMRDFDREAMLERTREQTLELIGQHADHPALAGLVTNSPKERPA